MSGGNREITESAVGIGFGSVQYPQQHATGAGPAIADTFMQQHLQRQNQSNTLASQRMSTSAAFVPAHILDPNYQFYTNTAPAPPPPPPSLPSQEAATALHIQIPPPPPPPPLMWSSEYVAVLPRPPPPPDTRRPDPVSRPFKSSFATYGYVATERTRREQSLSPSPSPSRVVLAPAPAPTVGAPDSVVAEVQLARDRAMKIIQQFQENDPFRADSEIAQKRKASLEQLERRKRIAMVKNLEYLAKAEDERLAAKLQQAQEAQNLQIKMEASHQQSLQIRLQHFGKGGKQASGAATTTSQAGIGTQQRQRVEDKRRKQHQQASTDTVAIYVSNLPTDGSVGEELLRALFGGLGYSLRKIHFYVKKETGELKGDALVVYELPSSQERSTLTETVCSQMNGAELPCGTALKVEPSDPLYKLRKKKDAGVSNGNHYGPASQLAPEVIDNDENVDDFLASLDGDENKGDGGQVVSAEASSKKEAIAAANQGDDDDDLDGFFESLT